MWRTRSPSDSRPSFLTSSPRPVPSGWQTSTSSCASRRAWEGWTGGPSRWSSPWSMRTSCWGDRRWRWGSVPVLVVTAGLRRRQRYLNRLPPKDVSSHHSTATKLNDLFSLVFSSIVGDFILICWLFCVLQQPTRWQWRLRSHQYSQQWRRGRWKAVMMDSHSQ